MDSGFDYGSESEKLGGVKGVIKLKAGDELTFVITGPIIECQDRFGSGDFQTKYSLGVYCCDTRSRGVLLLSWKGKQDFDEENRKRPFKTHMVRYSRTGSTKEATRYTVVSIAPIPPSVAAEAAAAAPLDVRAVAAQITARALAKPGPEAATPTTAAAGATTGYVPPAATGYTPPSAAPNGHSHMAAPYVPTSAPQAGSAYVDELRRADSAIAGGLADGPKVLEHVKKLLTESLGKDRVLTVCQNAGVVKGTQVSFDQLRHMIAQAIDILQPKPVSAMANAMGVPEDDLPF